MEPLAHAVEPVYPEPPHCPYFATVPDPEPEPGSVVPPPPDAIIAGIEMLAIVQTFPPSEEAIPVYVVPPDTPRVFPKVGSAAANVMTVFWYV